MTLVTGERPTDDAPAARGQDDGGAGMLGLRLEQLTPSLRERSRYEGEGQVFVRAVRPGSDADRAGLEAGDIILQADRKPVGSVKDVSSALRDGKALLYIERGPQRFFKSIVRTK